MDKIISNIIAGSFEKEYFLDYGSAKTEGKIIQQIEEFNNKFPDAVSTFFRNITATISEAKIENITQFFNLDRCIRFLVQFNEENRFVCQFSIYGYFSVYQSPCCFNQGKYIYGDRKFINRNESEVCDLLYACSNVLPSPIIWLDRSILATPVFDLSIPHIGYMHVITIAEVLFTEHYI